MPNPLGKGVAHRPVGLPLRLAQRCAVIPWWAWLVAAGLLALPWYFRYFYLALGACGFEHLVPRLN